MRLVLAIAIGLAASVVAVPAASAAELTPRGESSVVDVADLLYVGSTTTTRPAPRSAALGDAWRTQELQGYGQGTPGQNLGSELEKLRRGSRLKWGFRILGRASLVSFTGQVGFEIGSVLADEIYEQELPAKPALTGWDPGFAEVYAVQKGDCIQLAGWPASWGPPAKG